MYKLRYEKLPQYESQFGDQIRVVAGDTDIFFLQVRNISVANQLLPAMKNDKLLDISNYPSENPLFSVDDKAQLGRVKDECAGVPIQDAIFLRPKCYSLLLVNNKQHKRAKGIQRAVVENEINHTNYINVIIIINLFKDL